MATKISLDTVKWLLERIQERLDIAEDDIINLTASISAGDCLVHGANIYIQATEPTAPGDWVWIDTTGLDLIS